MKSFFILIGLACSLCGQQYPDPYGLDYPLPGGRIPGGKSGPDVVVDFHGTLSALTGKRLTLTLEEESKKGEENSMEIALSRKTVVYNGDKKVKVAALKTGEVVDVEVKRQVDGSLEAVAIHLAK